jgi:putative intracellular protease/amidase
MKVLIVLTSHSELGNTGKKTGFWVEEFAAPYYVLADAGIETTIASPKGGQPPIDPKSELPDFQTEATHRFDKDEALKNKLAHTHKLSEINAADFDAVFYPGGHGPLWDLANDADSIKLIETEEDAVELTDVVPFLVEDELKKLGGNYSKGADWGSYVVKDGLLITGQNPGSSAEAAQELLKLLKA